LTVAGNGTLGTTLSQLYHPTAVLVDLNGYMYIADAQNYRILRWTPGANAGQCITACTTSPGVAPNQLNVPTSIAFDSSGSLYVNDELNNRVQKFQILNGTCMKSV
jgi:sugar lactone lactonase YvrE